MFPVTHGCAAVIATQATASLLGQPELASPLSLGASLVMGALPDVPAALVILAGRFDKDRHRHHQWITHTPIFWIAAGLLVGLIVSPRWGAQLAACSLLHLGTDWYGGGDGIPYLWPLTRRQFGVALTGYHGTGNMFGYLTNGAKGVVEICITLAGAILLFLSLL